MATTRITLVSNWTDPKGGKTFDGGQTITVASATARDLIARGKARDAHPAGASADPDVAPDEPEPTTTEAKPTGTAKTAQVKSRGTIKEVAADG